MPTLTPPPLSAPLSAAVRRTSRRVVLRTGALAGLGAAAVAGARTWSTPAASASSELALAASTTCATVTQEETEGPYWVDEQLNRSDVRYDTGSASTAPTTPVSGTPLTLTINLTNAATCSPEVGAYVDIWHCNAAGLYSDVSNGGTSEAGHNFLRGYQVSDSAGSVTFTTIYPGWYSGRTVHIHVRVRTSLGASTTVNFTTQIFFPESVNSAVEALSSYSHNGATRTTTNSNDNLYDASLQITPSGDTTTGYTGTFNVVLDFDDSTSTASAGSTTTPTSTTTPITSTTSTTGSTSSSSGAVTTDDLVRARVGGVSVLSRRGRRMLRVAITPHEKVAAKILLLDHDDVLAKRSTGWLAGRRRAVGLEVPASVPAGTYHVQTTLADEAGNKKITRRLVHLPAR